MYGKAGAIICMYILESTRIALYFISHYIFPSWSTYGSVGKFSVHEDSSLSATL